MQPVDSLAVNYGIQVSEKRMKNIVPRNCVYEILPWLLLINTRINARPLLL